MFDNKLKTILLASATSALAQGLMFGTYDYFKNKGYGGWQAGALMGGVLGLAGGVVLSMTQTGETATAGCLAGNCGGLAGVTITQLPKAIGYFTAQELSGITVEQLNGVGLRVA